MSGVLCAWTTQPHTNIPTVQTARKNPLTPYRNVLIVASRFQVAGTAECLVLIREQEASLTDWCRFAVALERGALNRVAHSLVREMLPDL
jgi:hypothetical protein